MGKDFKGKSRNWSKDTKRDKLKDVDTNDPVQKMFGEISVYLDSRHDKKERIVKLSRDITIESKRIIFCLHRIKNEDDTNKNSIIEEAEKRLADLRENLWLQIMVRTCQQHLKLHPESEEPLPKGSYPSQLQSSGPLVCKELRDEDHYQYIRAYSAGLQEWIEALSFYYFLKYKKISSFAYVQQQLEFRLDKSDAVNDTSEMPEKESDSTDGVVVSVTVPQSEYILGIADLTGELMRNAINALGAGNMEICFVLLEILQSMAEGFGKLSRKDTPREFGQKLWTLKQSCKKVENACYAISVRGTEIPKNHLADIFVKKDDDKHDDNYSSVDDFYCN